MKLKEVACKDDLERYYAANNLTSMCAKIDNLWKEMKILAVRGEEETLEEQLAGLEELAILGYWERDKSGEFVDCDEAAVSD